jgi:periplasmic copper chaperone A
MSALGSEPLSIIDDRGNVFLSFLKGLRILSCRYGFILTDYPYSGAMLVLLRARLKRRTFRRKQPMSRGAIAIRSTASELTTVHQTPTLICLLTEIASRAKLLGTFRHLAAGVLVSAAAIAVSSAAAADEAIRISDAWVHAADQAGGNVALSMTIKNEADAADALMRVRCPVANFSEKHTVDRGEGAPAMRPIPSIPIAANTTTTLKSDAYHVMLLQTRQALVAGEAFKCAIVFQKAGTIETEVKIREKP